MSTFYLYNSIGTRISVRKLCTFIVIKFEEHILLWLIYFNEVWSIVYEQFKHDNRLYYNLYILQSYIYNSYVLSRSQVSFASLYLNHNLS